MLQQDPEYLSKVLQETPPSHMRHVLIHLQLLVPALNDFFPAEVEAAFVFTGMSLSLPECHTQFLIPRNKCLKAHSHLFHPPRRYTLACPPPGLFEAALPRPQQLALLCRAMGSVGKLECNKPTISCLPRQPYHRILTPAGLN